MTGRCLYTGQEAARMEGMPQTDTEWMLKAVELSRKGVGTTSPNPPVGAVIVKDGSIIGEGWHEKAGEAHAERRAIADALAKGQGGHLPGSTIYVTLEPCSSHGKTPPCTAAIIEHGISRVVYGMVDPDARHRGKADAILKAAGIEVQGGLCAEECREVLRPWLFATEHGRPWVVAKVASTLDAKMVRQSERWISDPEALKHAHQLRLESDAILVGGETVRRDNPALTIRTPLTAPSERKEQPWRIVMTRHRADLPAGATLFTDEHSARTLVLENVEDYPAMLQRLYAEHGIITLMLECGGNLLREFLDRGLVNEWVQDIAPILSGGAAQVVPGDFLACELHLERTTFTQAGKDLIIRGILPLDD